MKQLIIKIFSILITIGRMSQYQGAQEVSLVP